MAPKKESRWMGRAGDILLEREIEGEGQSSHRSKTKKVTKMGQKENVDWRLDPKE